MVDINEKEENDRFVEKEEGKISLSTDETDIKDIQIEMYAWNVYIHVTWIE